MTVYRQPVTSILGTSKVTSAQSAMQQISKEIVPMREEVFRVEDVDTPTKVSVALHRMQRHMAEATQAARSLPVQGGSYMPSVAFVANTATPLLHRIPGGLPVAWIPVAIRTGFANVFAQMTEVSQDAPRGKIALAASANCTADVWFFVRPSPVPQ